MSKDGSARGTAGDGQAWYRHPLLWLGSFVLLASLAGCVWMIVMAARYPDPPLDTGAGHAFRMPFEGERAPAAPR